MDPELSKPCNRKAYISHNTFVYSMKGLWHTYGPLVDKAATRGPGSI